MKPQDIIESVSALSREQVFTLLNKIEQDHDMKIMCVTRLDIEDAINPNSSGGGSGSWNMTDDEWQKFRLTYLWRKGIEEQLDYQFIYDWARDEWNDLGSLCRVKLRKATAFLTTAISGPIVTALLGLTMGA